MTTLHERTALELNRALSFYNAHPDVKATDDGVLIPLLTARTVVAKLGFVEGGQNVPFVRALLTPRSPGDIHLDGDVGMHLHRALNDIRRVENRRRQIDSGRIPGALSGAEVVRLARRHPHLFG